MKVFLAAIGWIILAGWYFWPEGHETARESFADNTTKIWVVADRLNRRTCAAKTCGVVGSLFFREGIASFEIKGDWVRVTPFYDALCVNGKSEHIDSGNNKCTVKNGISEGRFAEWVSIKFLSETRPADPGDSAIGREALIAQSDFQSTNTSPIEAPIRDDIIGQWRRVYKNPNYKNSVARQYMRHTFFDDGKLSVEEKESSTADKKWTFINGMFVVSSSYKKSKFIAHYELVKHDELVKIRFQSIIDGKPFADYNKNEHFVRQGSTTEKAMKIIDIFKSVNSAMNFAMNFIHPNSLEVGLKYTLSRKTPVMPSPPPPPGSSLSRILSDISRMSYAYGGQSIVILGRKKFRNTLWYKVMVNGNEGWIKSIALFGQELK